MAAAEHHFTTPEPPGQERKQEVISNLPNMPEHAREKALVFTGPVLYYFINDHLGTPQMVVDETGKIAWQGDYLPFGEVLILLLDDIFLLIRLGLMEGLIFMDTQIRHQ
uniref:RHS domain-containing protein n=1 Tax=Candidatus Electrothrix sp. TaxID=2170559 RepID=UPI0040576105